MGIERKARDEDEEKVLRLSSCNHEMSFAKIECRRRRSAPDIDHRCQSLIALSTKGAYQVIRNNLASIKCRHLDRYNESEGLWVKSLKFSQQKVFNHLIKDNFRVLNFLFPITFLSPKLINKI